MDERPSHSNRGRVAVLRRLPKPPAPPRRRCCSRGPACWAPWRGRRLPERRQKGGRPSGRGGHRNEHTTKPSSVGGPLLRGLGRPLPFYTPLLPPPLAPRCSAALQAAHGQMSWWPASWPRRSSRLRRQTAAGAGASSRGRLASGEGVRERQAAMVCACCSLECAPTPWSHSCALHALCCRERLAQKLLHGGARAAVLRDATTAETEQLRERAANRW